MRKIEESLADLAVKAGIDPDEAQYLFPLVYDEEKNILGFAKPIVTKQEKDNVE
jgi:hypothetical protein